MQIGCEHRLWAGWLLFVLLMNKREGKSQESKKPGAEKIDGLL